MSPNPSLPPPVARLIEALMRLPGIGPKSASRLAYYLLRAPEAVSLELAQALQELKASTRLCSVCFNITETDPCPICSDPSRDHSVVCVVEEPLDVAAIERAKAYRGVYHVLHGVLSPINGVGPDDLKINELVARIQRAQQTSTPIREVILATNPTVEGEMTAAFLQRKLSGLSVTLTRLARGLPVGGDLEYADEITLSRALEGRQPF
ncbi:MAG: recombination mediator RecR [Thermoflexales bacterium]